VELNNRGCNVRPDAEVAVFGSEYIGSLVRSARESARLRQNANVHTTYEDPCQRLFNALCAGTYIRPHRHSGAQGNELLVAISGSCALIQFTDEGCVSSVVLFGSEKHRCQPNIAAAVEISAGCWHSVVVLSGYAVLFEVKRGPFRLSDAKDFPRWAPEEGSADAHAYLAELCAVVRRVHREVDPVDPVA
jgi:cupin fold WbuC family metalloprotein